MSIFSFPARGLRETSALLIGIAATITACSAPASSSGTSAADGASGQNTGAVGVTKAESFPICPDGSRESGLNLIDDAKSWQAFVRSTSQRAPSLIDWKPNFVNSRVILVRLGSKSSAGYGVKVGSAKWTASDSEVVLSVHTSKPAPGSLNASLLTSPCLVVHIAHASFKTLKVVDLSEDRSLGQITQ
jgi:PrcB C-terminal